MEETIQKLYVEVSSRCNLRCKTCFRHSGIGERLGDVRPSEHSFKRSCRYANALDELVKAEDALPDTLTEKRKEMYGDYMTAQRNGQTRKI